MLTAANRWGPLFLAYSADEPVVHASAATDPTSGFIDYGVINNCLFTSLCMLAKHRIDVGYVCGQIRGMTSKRVTTVMDNRSWHIAVYVLFLLLRYCHVVLDWSISPGDFNCRFCHVLFRRASRFTMHDLLGWGNSLEVWSICTCYRQLIN